MCVVHSLKNEFNLLSLQHYVLKSPNEAAKEHTIRPAARRPADVGSWEHVILELAGIERRLPARARRRHDHATFPAAVPPVASSCDHSDYGPWRPPPRVTTRSLSPSLPIPRQ
jgi:hypothetical protein